MDTEEGIVTAVTATTAWVTITQSDACKSCSAGHSCTSPQNNQETTLEAANPVHAAVGDRILLNVNTTSLLKASFLIYILPLLCMLAGAGIGHGIGLAAGLNPSWTALPLAVTFFGAALLIMRAKGAQLARLDDYQPKILKVLTHDTSSAQNRVDTPHSGQQPGGQRCPVAS